VEDAHRGAAGFFLPGGVGVVQDWRFLNYLGLPVSRTEVMQMPVEERQQHVAWLIAQKKAEQKAIEEARKKRGS
jgi:hypothetical protein